MTFALPLQRKNQSWLAESIKTNKVTTPSDTARHKAMLRRLPYSPPTVRLARSEIVAAEADTHAGDMLAVHDRYHLLGSLA